MEKTSDKSAERSAELGMTLIEVMVSMVILGVVLVMLGQGLTLGIRMNTESKTKVSNLSICKRVTESFKSQIQSSTASFDSANNSFNKKLYYDADGKEIGTSETMSQERFFVVTVSVANWTDAGGNTFTDTTGNVLVKTLNVSVIAQHSAILSSKDAQSAREIATRVEMVRPSE